MATGRCLINTSNPDVDVLREFSELHTDFAAFVFSFEVPMGMTLPMLIRYMTLCYDKNSSIAIEHKGKWILKKKESAIRAKFPTWQDNGATKFTEEAESIIFNKNVLFLEIVTRYLAIQFDTDFQIYIVYKEMLLNVLMEIMKFKFDNPGQTAKAKQNADEIQEDIEKLEYKIFSGNEERTLKSLLYEEAYKSSLELRPESIVTKREAGEPIVDIKPYGENYEMPKAKFIGDV